MKKLFLITLTVAGGLYVQTATPPERQDHDTKTTTHKCCNKKTACLHKLSKTKLSEQA